MRVQVKAVSFFTRSSGLFGSGAGPLLEGGASGCRVPEETFTHWIATIQYAYAQPSKDPKTRRWNPLGFKVIDFKSEPEVIPEQSTEKDARHDS